MEYYTFLYYTAVCVLSICEFAYVRDRNDMQNITQNNTRKMSPEKSLIRDLLQQYETVGRHGRPVTNISDVVMVGFSMGLLNLDLNVKGQLLTVHVWAKYGWTDEYMVWDPEQYAGVKKIRLDPDIVWQPDIKLYNTAEANHEQSNDLLTILPDGSITWIIYSIFTSGCSIDVTNYPFDMQTCHFWFGSGTHSRDEIDLEWSIPGGVDTSTFQSDFKASCEWDLVNHTSKRLILPSADSYPQYRTLTLTFTLQRKVMFFTYILTLPCVFLAFLTLVVFCLPTDVDRPALALSIFSSFLVLLLILVEAAPPTTSSVPALGVYYCFNMALIMTAIVLTSWTTNIARRGRNTPYPLPVWVDAVVLRCASRLLCMYKSPSELSNSNRKPSTIGRCSNCCMSLNNTATSRNELATECEDYSTQYNKSRHNRENVDGLGSDVEHNQEAGSCSTARLWHHVAMVMDRMFFFLYIILIVVSLVLFFPRRE